MSVHQRYTRTAVVLHWLIAIAIFAMFALGWYMSDLPKEGPKQMAFDLFDLGLYTWQLSEEATVRTFYFNLHKSVGVTLLVLVFLRVLWRLTHTPPTMLATYSAFERKLATGVHHLLYLLMVLLPVSGMLMTLYSKYGLKWFGMDLLPGLDNKGLRDIFKESHEVIGTIILLVIAIHIIGALKHKFIDKDETMQRMF